MFAELFFAFILVLAIAGIGFSLLLLRRNNKVFEYRQKIIDRVGAFADQDIAAGRDWEWRYEALERVSYNQMLYRFWRSFDSFYEGKRFLDA